MITMKMTGLDHITRRITKILPDEIRKELAETTKDMAQKILALEQASAPVGTGNGWGGYPSGTLKNDLKIIYRDKGLTAKIGLIKSFARGFIGRFLNFGTKPHLIESTGNKLKIGGRFYESVMHPGIAARNWMLNPTENNLRLECIDRYASALRDAVRRAANQ